MLTDPQMSRLTGVILSAGKGTRIDPFNTHFPKPLLPIGNTPIMGHHLRMFRELGVKKTWIVVGHLMDRIIGHFGRGQSEGLEIHYAEQEKILGIAHAVGTVEHKVDGPFLLCLGDIFYLAEGMQRLVDRYARGDVAAVLAVKQESDPAPVKRNFTVELDADGYVNRVVEKPIKPRSLLKGCGIYLFGPEIFEAIRRTPRTALRDEYEITTSIQLMIEEGLKVAAESVISWDLNVTFPKDLLDGNLMWLDHVKARNLIDPSAQIHPEASLDRCVIGANVRILAPRILSECVILPNTELTEGEPLRRTIASGDLLTRC